MYRIEAIQPGVVDAVRQYGTLLVNGYAFREVEGRVLSDPIPEGEVGLFDVPGYILVRAEPPYERVAEMGQQAALVALDTALREGSLSQEEVEALKGEEAKPARKKR